MPTQEADFLEFKFKVTPLNPGVDILLAELSLLPFDSFEETESGINAYVKTDFVDGIIISNLEIVHSSEFEINYEVNKVPNRNWNSVWESNFKPVIINDKVAIRAIFHDPIQIEHEIIITPKMSFGTGHHETTSLLIEMMLNENFNNKEVLDMGCGTAILAILAEQLGASKLHAIDNDSWCYENSRENLEHNNTQNIDIILGGSEVIAENKYNLILANINRNVLLEDMAIYKNALLAEGILYLSGFYTEDLAIIKDHAKGLGLYFHSKKIKNNWVAAKFIF